MSVLEHWVRSGTLFVVCDGVEYRIARGDVGGLEVRLNQNLKTGTLESQLAIEPYSGNTVILRPAVPR
ncbi:MAG: hypothetical protein ACXWHZ_03500 [Usitatibacter sp.]